MGLLPRKVVETMVLKTVFFNNYMANFAISTKCAFAFAFVFAFAICYLRKASSTGKMLSALANIYLSDTPCSITRLQQTHLRKGTHPLSIIYGLESQTLKLIIGLGLPNIKLIIVSGGIQVPIHKESVPWFISAPFLPLATGAPYL